MLHRVTIQTLAGRAQRLWIDNKEIFGQDINVHADPSRRAVVTLSLVTDDCRMGPNVSPDQRMNDLALENLGLTTRTYNALSRSGLRTIGQLLELDDNDLLHLRNIGQVGLAQIRDRLAIHGLRHR